MKKNLIELLVLCIVLLLTCIYQTSIVNFIIENPILEKGVTIGNPNEYALSYSFQYVKNTDDFKVDSKQELLDIIYTGLNYGNDSFYFYCHYDDCEEDVNQLVHTGNLGNINNYVHPYNSFRKIYVSMNSLRKIELQIEKGYSKQMIESIHTKMQQIKSSIIKPNMTDREKIKAFHDYIIETTKYDSAYAQNNMNNIDSPSHKAVGPLFYGLALCGGYTDVMAIFLDELGIPNYRISSEYHVWNFVKLENTWYHLDLTWDDPVTSDNSDLLLDSFFLISTKTLESLDTSYHTFDKSIFKEANS